VLCVLPAAASRAQSDPPNPSVEVFELKGGSLRVDGKGRLAVYVRCSAAPCHGTQAGTKLTRFKLAANQAKAIRAHEYDQPFFAVRSRGASGPVTKLITDGLYCTRESPCTHGSRPQRPRG
jgi:hypothetical protein